MSRIVDLSPLVPQGFKGPPSTNIGVQFEVRTKPGYLQFAGIDSAPARAFALIEP
jgi:hypothetical protein